LLGFKNLRESGHPSRLAPRSIDGGGCSPVKKLLLLALAGFGALAIWKKVKSDRSELDLWTEATTSDD
jgi:hypothetical protein